MTARGFGVALPPDGQLDELALLARDVERLGYDTLWCNDDRLQRDVFVTLAVAAQATQRIALGPGVTNPYSRHPALIATAAATLDELSHGRAVVGLGAGGTNHRALGISRRRPAAALREAVEVIRGLLAGERITVDGDVVRTCEAELDFAPRRADLPIYIGARGPRNLELAGEVADGVIVGNVATAQGWEYALGRVLAGAHRAARDPATVRCVAWLYCAIDEDRASAIDAVRPMVATSLITSRPVLHELGVEMPAAFAEAMERRGWSLLRDAVTEGGRTLPEDVVSRFAIAGTPEDCRRALDALLAAAPQIAEVVIVPFATARTPVQETIRRFIRDVAAAPVGAAAAGGA